MAKKKACDECGEVLPAKMTVTIKRKTLCRTCMLKDEEPIRVTLVRSNWAPWGEEAVTPLGDLLYNELSGKKTRRKIEAPMVVAAMEKVG